MNVGACNASDAFVIINEEEFPCTKAELVAEIHHSATQTGTTGHVTGHSLGGTIAMFVTVHTGLVSGGHIFNPGAGVKTEEMPLLSRVVKSDPNHNTVRKVQMGSTSTRN